MEGLPEKIPTLTVDTPNQAVDGMRQELYKVEAREKELSTKFSDKHPQVIALRSTIAELKGILGDQEQVRSSETTGVNPSWQSLELALLNERSNADSLKARSTKLAEQRSHLDGQGSADRADSGLERSRSKIPAHQPHVVRRSRALCGGSNPGKLLKPRAHTTRSEAKPARSVRLSVRSGYPRAERKTRGLVTRLRATWRGE
jgi:hypothetical protein